MAIVNVSAAVAQSASKLDSKTRLPRDRYTLRLQKREFGVSKSSGNPMITNTWELASPNEVVGTNGTKIVVAGTTFTQYLPTVVYEDAQSKKRDDAKTSNAQKRFAEEYEKCGMKLTEFDDENPPLLPEGVLVEAICSSKEEVDYKDDRKTPIKNADGTDRKRLVHVMEQILGKSTTALNTPF